MADIGKDRFGEQEEEEGRKKKFQVIDKRFLADEEATVVEVAPPPPAPAAPERAPSEMVEETMKAGKTIKIDMSSTVAAPEPPAAPEPEPVADEGQLPAGLNPDPLAISNAMLFFIEELFSRVLIFLGLTPNPQTGLTVQNLDQAQKGIQLIELLIGEVRRELKSPEIDQNLVKMIAQLKAAYVQIVTGGGLGSPGGGGGPMGPGGR